MITIFSWRVIITVDITSSSIVTVVTRRMVKKVRSGDNFIANLEWEFVLVAA